MDLTVLDIAGPAAAGLGGATIGGFLVRAWLKSLIDDVRELRKEVENLKTERVASVERRVEEMVKACPVRHQEVADRLAAVNGVEARIGEELRNVTGWLKKIDLNVAATGQQVAALQAEFAARVEWIRNLNTSQADLQRELHEHCRDRIAHRAMGAHPAVPGE